jgi:Ca2+-binding RTX toxin-like protein
MAIVLSDAADVGTVYNNQVYALAGDDNIRVRALSSEIFAGSGNDTVVFEYWNPDAHLFLHPFRAWIFGEEGSDSIAGSYTIDFLYGGIGNDILSGHWASDYLDGGSGDDSLNGDDHNDVLFGGDQSDFLDGGLDNDQMYGGDGNDYIIEYSFVSGQINNDLAFGDAGTGYIALGGGRDFLFGGDGADACSVRMMTIRCPGMLGTMASLEALEMTYFPEEPATTR